MLICSRAVVNRVMGCVQVVFFWRGDIKEQRIAYFHIWKMGIEVPLNVPARSGVNRAAFLAMLLFIRRYEQEVILNNSGLRREAVDKYCACFDLHAFEYTLARDLCNVQPEP